MDGGGYLLLSQAFCVGSGGFVGGGGVGGVGAFVFHLLQSRKMINKRVESVMSEEPVAMPETPHKTHRSPLN